MSVWQQLAERGIAQANVHFVDDGLALEVIYVDGARGGGYNLPDELAQKLKQPAYAMLDAGPTILSGVVVWDTSKQDVAFRWEVS